MSTAFSFDRRVEFRDTDAAGILHFASYFAYMEEAEHAFLRHRGVSVMQENAEGTMGWPRVSATCDFSGSAKFEQVLRIEVSVERIGTKSVTYNFRFHRDDDQVIATGEMTSVCCRIVQGQRPHSIPIPAEFKVKLGQGTSS